MTLQIDSLAISADEADTQDLQIDQLLEQVDTLDADILSAIELRTDLVRKLAAATDRAADSIDSKSFDDLGSDGSVIARMLSRIASATR